jgi:hypothetical protein
MALNTLRHQLVLGYIDNPSPTTEDAVDLGDTSSGYTLTGFTIGPVEPKAWYKQDVRSITITLTIQGSTPATGTVADDLINKYRRLVRYVEATKDYMESFGGNIPARFDGMWQAGHAAILTMQLQNTSNQLYWECFDGSVVLPDNLTDLPWNQNLLEGVVLTLRVRAGGRGPRVYLDNLVACGDAAPPFNPSDVVFDAGWTFSGSWSINSLAGMLTPFALLGSAGGLSATTNEPASASNNYAAFDWVLPRISLYMFHKPSSGNLTVTLEAWNGTAWSTVQTLCSINSGSSQAANTWYDFVGTAFQLNPIASYQKLRLNLNTGTTGTQVSFTKMAIWHWPNNWQGAVTDPAEFLSGGKIVGIPAVNVYNVQGDMQAPCQLIVADQSGGGSGGVVAAGLGYIDHGWVPFFAAAGNQNILADQPLYAMDFQTANGSADATVWWGKLGVNSSGAATSSTYTSVFSNSHNFDRRVRKYVAWLAYAANDLTLITSVQLKIATSFGNEVKTYNRSLPQTYTGNTTPVAANYRLYRLGDLVFSRPGIPVEDLSTNLLNTATIVVNHSNSANRNMAVQGVILLPADQFGIIDLLGAQSIGTNCFLAFDSEATAPRALAGTLTNYLWTTELSSFQPTATLKGGNFRLRPQRIGGAQNAGTANRFEVLLLKNFDLVTQDHDSFLYDASKSCNVIVQYSPRYSGGLR